MCVKQYTRSTNLCRSPSSLKIYTYNRQPAIAVQHGIASDEESFRRLPTLVHGGHNPTLSAPTNFHKLHCKRTVRRQPALSHTTRAHPTPYRSAHPPTPPTAAGTWNVPNSRVKRTYTKSAGCPTRFSRGELV